MKFEVKPLVGIYFDKGEIKFGASKDEVRHLLGNPEVQDNIFYYFNSELSIHFNQDEKVEFIEFLSGREGGIQPVLYNKNIFNTLADEMYSVLEDENKGEVEDNENGYSYVFKNISVGLYRECTPDAVIELIEEMKNEGLDVNNNTEILTETEKANYYATVGIGKINYYE